MLCENDACLVKEVFLTLLFVLIYGLIGQDNDPFKTEPPKKPKIKEIGDGILQVGTVRLNKRKKEISFLSLHTVDLTFKIKKLFLRLVRV